MSEYRNFLADLIEELYQSSQGGMSAEGLEAMWQEDRQLAAAYSAKNRAKHSKEKKIKPDKDHGKKEGE